VQSMTGFGRGSAQAGTRTFTVEIRTLNHRFAEYVIHLPRELGVWEERLRRELGVQLSRGRVEVWVNMRGQSWPKSVRIDERLAQAYVKVAQEVARQFDLTLDLTPAVLLGLPEVTVVEEQEVDLDLWWPTCAEALDKALTKVLAMRQREGEALKEDMTSRLTVLEQLAQEIKSLADKIPDFYRNKLQERLATLGQEVVDENRLAQEVVFMAERADINEEVVRLFSHLQQFSATLDLDEPVGRRLEFLLQEANREVNTIGSKAQDSNISSLVVKCKAELEKLREQAQNVE
jgi:uncharacterized protein (TIGR00255 family)